MTARHRLSLLSKEVSLSAGFVVIVTLLQLLANLFSADNMKYRSLESFLEAYPVFQERSNVEKEKLFHTANWMHILFQITTAKKNKGLVMSIIPKFVGRSLSHAFSGNWFMINVSVFFFLSFSHLHRGKRSAIRNGKRSDTTHQRQSHTL